MQLRIVRLDSYLIVATLLCGSLVGCAPKSELKTDATQNRDVEIHLLVVDDPDLAAAIDRLRSEWKARSGAAVSVATTTAAELLAAPNLRGPLDAIVYPSGLLGPLAERGWLVPLPADYTANRELAWSDTFELLQIAETQWGQVPLAVPLGSPVFTCYYRADLLERAHRRPPRTWSEYHELADLLSRRDNLGDAAPPDDATWFGCAEPLAKGWGGRLLLARAAAYAKHRDQYSTLFNIETMEPLVGGPAFVRALEELMADARLGPANPLALDPAAARKELLEGHCALALSWPGHPRAGSGDQAAKQPPVGFIELPGSADVYNVAAKTWQNRQPDEDPHVTLLSAAGRLGSVAGQAAQPEHAFQLLAWLSGKDWGGTIGSVSSASPATTLYRRRQLRDPQPWVDPGTDAEAAQRYAASVQSALSRSAYLFALRIPGQEKYLAALDAAVEQAVGGQQSAVDALRQAAAEWTKIVDELGRESQRQAYRKSLGLEP